MIVRFCFNIYITVISFYVLTELGYALTVMLKKNYLFIKLFKVDNAKKDTVYKNTYKIAWG